MPLAKLPPYQRRNLTNEETIAAISKLHVSHKAGQRRVIKAVRSNNTGALGWLFWNAFVALPKGKVRLGYQLMWRALPPRLRKACEEF
jgi:hypothetical protein